MVRKFKFRIVLVDGKDIDEMMEYGDSVYGRIGDSFEVEVEAENRKDAREKILYAAEALKSSWRP